MKKNLFLFSVAALALGACSNDTTVEQADQTPKQPKEIAFSPLNQNLTRATTQYAIDGTAFPTTQDMYVAAYQVSPVAENYFAGTNFTYNSTATSTVGSNVWSGVTKRYWPLAPAYINFLAYANVTGSASFDGTTPASAATITQTDNSSAQTDLLYAIGNGEVTQSGNVLTFPNKVDMEFQHAQAWVDFYVKANSTVEEAIKINSITLNGASYSGTFTITHNNYDANAGQSVTGAWTSLGAKGKNSSDVDTNVAAEVASGATAVAVPGISGSGQSLSSSDFEQAGNGLMIVPDDNNTTADFISFTINYTFDGHTYDYTFTPATATAANVDQKKHYIYQITFKLHEIYVAATVNDWADQSATGITINE